MEISDTMMGRFFKSQMFERFQAQENTERAAQHVSLAAERATAQQAGADELSRLEPLQRKLDKEYGKKKTAADEALAALASINVEIASVRHQTHHHLSRLDQQLRQLADPRIDAADRRFERRLEKLRKPDAIRHDTVVESDRFGEEVVRVRTNRAGIRRLIVAVVEARRQVDELKLSAVDDLPAAIASIAAGINWDDAQTLEFDDES